MRFTICHLYGNLLNTYGDNGNLLMLQHLAKQQNFSVDTHLVSLGDDFVPEKYDFVFMGGGQDYEQKVVAKDMLRLKPFLEKYIEKNGVLLAICGGYQLLGQYYETADGEYVEGVGLLPHHTVHQKNNRFIGDVSIKSEFFNDEYVGFENHNGKTYLGEGEKPLGLINNGFGNNGEDGTEGAIYHNVICSYFHGPLLVRNPHLARRLIQLARKVN